MGKIKSVEEIVRIVRKEKNEGKKVSLITGCFDIVHIGHIKLFHFAKRHSDVVVVGLENDKNVKLSKGLGRPIYRSKERGEFLFELKSIDWIFVIKDVVNFDSPDADKVYLSIYKKIQPNFLVTNQTDRFWKNKRKNAKEIGVRLLLDRGKKVGASTTIIEKLKAEIF